MKISPKSVSKILTVSIVFGSLTFSPTFFDLQELKTVSSVAYAKLDASQVGKIMKGIFKFQQEFQKFKSARNKKKLSKEEQYQEKLYEVIEKEGSEAIKLLTEAIKIDPTKVKAYQWRALRYRLMDNDNAAIEDYNKVLEIDPNYLDAYDGRADVYRSSKNYTKAIDDYTKIIDSNPQYPDAYNDRAYCYYELKDYKNAIADYTKLISLEPNVNYYLLNRANCYFNSNDYERAIVDYTKYLQAVNPNNINNPKLHGIYNCLGDCYMAIGESAKAREAYMMGM